MGVLESQDGLSDYLISGFFDSGDLIATISIIKMPVCQ